MSNAIIIKFEELELDCAGLPGVVVMECTAEITYYDCDDWTVETDSISLGDTDAPRFLACSIAEAVKEIKTHRETIIDAILKDMERNK